MVVSLRPRSRDERLKGIIERARLATVRMARATAKAQEQDLSASS